MGTDRVRSYFDALPPERRAALEALRALVREVTPGAAETFRYRVPTYERGGVICAFASQKRYLSLYLDPEVVEAHRQALATLDVGKSCIRFKRLADLPLDEVRAMLREVMARLGESGA
jgi:uncharacterized protein YdhG (YjbR/CyaY superfamily)